VHFESLTLKYWDLDTNFTKFINVHGISLAHIWGYEMMSLADKSLP